MEDTDLAVTPSFSIFHIIQSLPIVSPAANSITTYCSSSPVGLIDEVNERLPDQANGQGLFPDGCSEGSLDLFGL